LANNSSARYDPSCPVIPVMNAFLPMRMPRWIDYQYISLIYDNHLFYCWIVMRHYSGF
jgi:hypothetical protein